jgi:thiol-disulfide isomerase/thioredoxin
MQNSEQVCPVLMTALTDSVERLGESLEKVEQTIEDNKMNLNEKKRIQRIYMQDNIRYWLFSRTIQERCQSNIVNILYFFSEDCDICPDQGVVLSYYKRKYQNDVLIFPINTDVEEDMVNLIKTQFNITEYPTIVVNGVPYTGVIDTETLGTILCEIIF